MKTYKLALTYTITMLVMTSCGSNTPLEHFAEVNEGIENMESQPIAPVETAFIQCTGEIAVQPKSEIAIHSPISGLINSIQVMEGEHVKKGQVLGTLEHLSIIQLQEDYLATKANFEFEQKNYTRKVKLYEENVISDKEFEQHKQAYQMAQAHFEGLKQQILYVGLSIDKLNANNIQSSIPITSSIRGVMTHVAIKNGQFAAQDTELFRLLDDSHKHVHLKVFAKDANQLKEGQTIWLKTADSKEEYKAKIFLIGKSIEPGTNTISVHGHLVDGEENLIVGSFIYARIMLKE